MASATRMTPAPNTMMRAAAPPVASCAMSATANMSRADPWRNSENLSCRRVASSNVMRGRYRETSLLMFVLTADWCSGQRALMAEVSTTITQAVRGRSTRVGRVTPHGQGFGQIPRGPLPMEGPAFELLVMPCN